MEPGRRERRTDATARCRGIHCASTAFGFRRVQRRAMAIPQRFSLVTLGVTDVEAATAFYRRIGWRQSTHSADGTTFFTTPGPVIALWSSAELAVDGGISPEADAATATTSADVALAVDFDTREQVDAALADWRTAGGEVSKPAEETEWGGYSGYGRDPNGDLKEFARRTISGSSTDSECRTSTAVRSTDTRVAPSTDPHGQPRRAASRRRPRRRFALPSCRVDPLPRRHAPLRRREPRREPGRGGRRMLPVRNSISSRLHWNP